MRRFYPPRSGVIEFGVIGEPATQGSKSAIVRNDRAIIVEGRGTPGRLKHKKWRGKVQGAAMDVAMRKQLAEPLVGELAVCAVFRLPMPTNGRHSSHKLRGWKFADRGLDIDKLIRAVLDSLKDGGLISNDSRVAFLAVQKIEVTPGNWTGVEIAVGRVQQTNGLAPHPFEIPTIVAA